MSQEKPVEEIEKDLVKLRVEESSEPIAVTPENRSVETSDELPKLGDRYEVLEKIGQGGMGSVYKVLDKTLGKTFAVKILRYELAQDKDAVKRFTQEAEAASRLTHANLGNVYDQGKTGSGAPYLVMDYLNGLSLSDVIRNEEISLDRFFDIFIQVCEGLDHAHKKGIIHRDLKPSNIIISKSPDGNDLVHLVDFGIAKVLAKPGETLTSLTQTGDIFGSPLYMSPEQCEGGTIDVRSDIYSLGCVFYEAFAKEPPFAGNNPFKVMLKQVSEPPPDMTRLRIPSKLAKVINCCLHKNPKFRYQSANDLLRDLVDVSRDKPPERYPKLRPDEFPSWVNDHDNKRAESPRRSSALDSPMNLVGEDRAKAKPLTDALRIVVSVFLVVTGFSLLNLLMSPKPTPNKAKQETARAQDLEYGMAKAARKYISTHDYVKATSLLEVMVGKDRADKDYEQLALDLQWLAACYTESGDYFGANRCFKEAIETYQSMGPSYQGGVYQTLTQFASSLRKQKRDKEAEIYEKQAREIQPPGTLRTDVTAP